MPLTDFFIIIILFLCAFSIYHESSCKKQAERKRFEGQVSGFLAGLSLCGVYSSITGQDIFALAKSELERINQTKGGPALGTDPLYYSGHREFGEFSLLCIEKYAHTYALEKEDEALLQFCNEHMNQARRLTERIPTGW